MRLGDENQSSNFEDHTGRSGFGGFGGGGRMLGLLFGFVLSRFGIGGVLILLLGYCALSTFGGGGGSGPAPSQVQSGASGSSTLDPATKDMVLRVLGSTERRWTDLFAQSGRQYEPTTLVFYSRSDQSGCGAAQSAMGPFYCPSDRKIYLDASFFEELRSRFGAEGDFAAAYVIAHEVGQHVQHLTGTLDRAHNMQSRASA